MFIYYSCLPMTNDKRLCNRIEIQSPPHAPINLGSCESGCIVSWERLHLNFGLINRLSIHVAVPLANWCLQPELSQNSRKN